MCEKNILLLYIIMNDLFYKIIKYALFVIILILALKYLPQNTIEIQNIVIILVIVVATQFFLDYICEQKLKIYVDNCKCEVPKKSKDVEVVENFTQVDDTENAMEEVREVLAGEEDTSVLNANSDSDMLYSQLDYDNYDPMGQLNNKNRRKYRDSRYKGEYGDWFIPPEEWYPPCVKPPVCVTNNGCPVQPVYTSNGYADLREFDNSRRVTQENISIPFVRERNGIDRPATTGMVSADMRRKQRIMRAKEQIEQLKKRLENEDLADDLDNVQKKAQDILSQAQKQANQIKKDAMSKADELSSTAKNKSNEILQTAKNKSNDLTSTAKDKSNEVLQTAQKKADNIQDYIKQYLG